MTSETTNWDRVYDLAQGDTPTRLRPPTLSPPGHDTQDLRHQLLAAEQTIAQLKQALEHSRDIGAAIGIIMATLKVTQDQAFHLLARASMAGNCKLRDLALHVVATGDLAALSSEPSTQPLPNT